MRHWIRKNKRYLLAILGSLLMVSWLLGAPLMSLLRRSGEARGEIRGRTVTPLREMEAARTGHLLTMLINDLMRLRMTMFQLQASPDALTQQQAHNLRVSFRTLAGLLQALDVRYRDMLSIVKKDQSSERFTQEDVWRYLVLLYEAEEAGIDASRAEVDARIDAIVSLREQRDVDWGLVQSLLRRLGNNENDIRRVISHLIEVSKLVEFKSQSLPATTTELWAYYRFRNDEARVRFVEFRPEVFTPLVEADKEDLRAFYQAHKETIPDPEQGKVGYMNPPRAKVACAIAKYEDFEGEVSVSDEEIEQYYENNKSEFIEPPEEAEGEGGGAEGVEPTPEEPPVPGPDEQERPERDAGAEAEQEPAAGEPLPPDVRQGQEGQAGERVQPLLQNSQPAVSVDEGGTDEPVPSQPDAGESQPPESGRAGQEEEKTEQATEEKPEAKEAKEVSYRPLSEVRDQIKEQLLEQKAREAAREATDAVMEDLQRESEKYVNEPLPLEQMARRHGLPYRVLIGEDGSVYLTRDEIGSVVPDVRQLPSFALDGTLYLPRQFSESSGIRICQVLDRREATVQPFSDVRDRVLKDYRIHQALQKAEEFAKELVKTAGESSLEEAVAQMNSKLESLLPEPKEPPEKQGDSAEQEASRVGDDEDGDAKNEKKDPDRLLTTQETELFSRSNPWISAMGGRRSRVVDIALKMVKGERATVVDGQNPRVCYAIEKIGHKPASREGYYSRQQILRRSYTRQKNQRLLDAWLDRLVAASKPITEEAEEKKTEET